MAQIWFAFLIICAAGAVGGLVNALITDNGFFLPSKEDNNHTYVIRPGFLGNILVGIVAALVSWGLYSSFGSAELFQPLPPSTNFTITTVVGAMLVGIGGARWLTNEVDKRLLHAAAVQAASTPASPEQARNMVAASPSEIFNLTKPAQTTSQEAA